MEDDPLVRDVILRTLEVSEFDAWSLQSGAGVIDSIHKNNINLVILDLGLPDVNGLEVMREIRAQTNARVIILSALAEPTDKIVGLEVGADDYLAKPFVPRELLARVRSVLRRTSPSIGSENKIISFGHLRLDPLARAVTSADGTEIVLTSGEFDLLLALVEHPNQALTRNQLMDLTDNSDSPAFDRSIDVRIGRLRKKIEIEPENPKFIKTVRNVGYIFVGDVTIVQAAC